VPAAMLITPNLTTATYPLTRAKSPAASSEDFAYLAAAILQVYSHLYAVHARVAVLCTPPPATATATASSTASSSSTTDDATNQTQTHPDELDEETLHALCRLPAHLWDPADAAANDATAAADAPAATDETRVGLCEGVAARLQQQMLPPKQCRTVVEVRLGKSAKRLAAWVASHRKTVRSAGGEAGRAVKGAKDLWYRQDALGYLWLPLTYALAAAEQVPGAPYPEDVTHTVHYPISPPLEPPTADGSSDESAEVVACGAHAEGAWTLDGAPVDSCGRPTSGRGQIGHILSTM